MLLTLNKYNLFKYSVLMIDIIPLIFFSILLVFGDYSDFLGMTSLIVILILTSSAFLPVPILSILNIIILVVSAIILIRSKRSVVEEEYRSTLVSGVIFFSLFTALYLFLFYVIPITISH